MKKKRKLKMTVVGLNIPAYTRTETRHGPPLDYISEKLSSALLELHYLCRTILQEEIIETRIPGDTKRRMRATFEEEIECASWNVFYQTLKSFLGLNNLLSIIDEQGICEKLLAMDYDEFQKWLRYVETEGSTTGIPESMSVKEEERPTPYSD